MFLSKERKKKSAMSSPLIDNSQTYSPEEQIQILFSGLAMEKKLKQNMRSELFKKLKEKRPLIVKAGFDPSSPDLHIGHSLLINKLRQFQELGHQVVFVVGDFTACVGDPSGKNKTRPVLSAEQTKKNAQTYIEQAVRQNFETTKKLSQEEQWTLSFFKRLDHDKTKWLYNSEWLNKLPLQKWILFVFSKFTVAGQLERNDFYKRYSEGKPIRLHEFLYPILQAYDSVELKADIEIGGTDQLFNLMLGRELQEQYQQSPQVVLTLPLLEGIDVKQALEENWNLDGSRKMSKSLNNTITFNDKPREMFGKIMKISDNLLARYWELFTEGRYKIKNQLKSKELHPKKEKEKLAWLLACSFYGEKQADKAKEEFNRVFSQKKIPDDIKQYLLVAGEIAI